MDDFQVERPDYSVVQLRVGASLPDGAFDTFVGALGRLPRGHPLQPAAKYLGRTAAQKRRAVSIEEGDRYVAVRARVAADGEAVVQPIGDQVARRHLDKVPKDAAAADGVVLVRASYCPGHPAGAGRARRTELALALAGEGNSVVRARRGILSLC